MNKISRESELITYLLQKYPSLGLQVTYFESELGPKPYLAVPKAFTNEILLSHQMPMT